MEIAYLDAKQASKNACPVCKQYTLHPNIDQWKVGLVCLSTSCNWHSNFFEKRNVIFENKLKHFGSVLYKLGSYNYSETQIDCIRDHINNELYVAKNGYPGSRRGKLRNLSEERLNNILIPKWIREKMHTAIGYIEHIEIINRLYNKPQLTNEQFEEIRELFIAYLRFLHRHIDNTSINYRTFLSKAVITLQYDRIIPNPASKTTVEELWEQFLDSDEFKDRYFERNLTQYMQSQIDSMPKYDLYPEICVAPCSLKAWRYSAEQSKSMRESSPDPACTKQEYARKCKPDSACIKQEDGEHETDARH